MAVSSSILVGTSVGSTVGSIDAQNKARRAEKEANAVATAAQKTQDRNMLKQKQREQRIRAAQIQQSAANTGVTGSSGEFGALGSLQTMYSGLIAQVQGQQNASDAITALNNKRSNYISQSNTFQAFGNLMNNSYNIFNPA